MLADVVACLEPNAHSRLGRSVLDAAPLLDDVSGGPQRRADVDSDTAHVGLGVPPYETDWFAPAFGGPKGTAPFRGRTGDADDADEQVHHGGGALLVSGYDAGLAAYDVTTSTLLGSGVVGGSRSGLVTLRDTTFISPPPLF